MVIRLTVPIDWSDYAEQLKATGDSPAQNASDTNQSKTSACFRVLASTV
ncbi:hypothetical protein GGQ18_002968 [Salinibacter ruber]|nr:hypothetical protein [Salinibacter ruber]